MLQKFFQFQFIKKTCVPLYSHLKQTELRPQLAWNGYLNKLNHFIFYSSTFGNRCVHLQHGVGLERWSGEKKKETYISIHWIH